MDVCQLFSDLNVTNSSNGYPSKNTEIWDIVDKIKIFIINIQQSGANILDNK